MTNNPHARQGMSWKVYHVKMGPSHAGDPTHPPSHVRPIPSSLIVPPNLVSIKVKVTATPHFQHPYTSSSSEDPSHSRRQLGVPSCLSRSRFEVRPPMWKVSDYGWDEER